MRLFFKKFDTYLQKHFHLLCLLLLLVILRIPNFFEPYWYGDEGIYLTIGTAMRQGEKLYLQIIDHKTPLIYYMAMVPNQLYFRILLTATMIVATLCFYSLAKKILKQQAFTVLATLLFIVFTTLPWFEGMIPNGELFVIFFVFVASYFFTKTSFFQWVMNEKSASVHIDKKVDKSNLLLTGIFLSLAILTKVPALFDAVAFLSVGWFCFVKTFWENKRKWSTHVAIPFWHTAIMGIGILVPIFLSIVYYILRGSGQAYLDYGLLYNFHYAASFVPSFSAAWIGILFTLKAKVLLLALFIALFTVITFFTKIFSHRFQFLANWFCLTLFASLLSNRPYPHYFLQVLPPLILMGTLVLLRIRSFVKEKSHLIEVPFGASFIALFIAVLIVLHVGLYSTTAYYGSFFQFATHQISAAQYRNSFNSLMSDNYAAAQLITRSTDQHMFIWGNNPVLYALTQKTPPGRFTVTFHIYDFNAMDETYRDVVQTSPKFIVVMKDEKDFPALDGFLEAKYIPNYSFEHFVLWKRL